MNPVYHLGDYLVQIASGTETIYNSPDGPINLTALAKIINLIWWLRR